MKEILTWMLDTESPDRICYLKEAFCYTWAHYFVIFTDYQTIITTSNCCQTWLLAARPRVCMHKFLNDEVFPLVRRRKSKYQERRIPVYWFRVDIKVDCLHCWAVFSLFDWSSKHWVANVWFALVSRAMINLLALTQGLSLTGRLNAFKLFPKVDSG